MTLKIAGIWCKTKSDFDKHTRSEEYDVIISHSDIYSRLLKSDPGDAEPSDVIISLYIQKLFGGLSEKYAHQDIVNVAFLFKNLNRETVLNFKNYIDGSFDKNSIELIIIDRCDYPKKGVLSLFDSVKFIDND